MSNADCVAAGLCSIAKTACTQASDCAIVGGSCSKTNQPCTNSGQCPAWGNCQVGGATCLKIPAPMAQATCCAVRARDLAGNRDANTVARCATPAGACFAFDDVIQPLFNARCVHCHSGASPPPRLL